MISIQNRKTKQVREVSTEDWGKIQKNDLTKDVYFEIKKAPKPPEVAKLEAKKAEKSAKKNTASTSEK